MTDLHLIEMFLHVQILNMYFICCDNILVKFSIQILYRSEWVDDLISIESKFEEF